MKAYKLTGSVQVEVITDGKRSTTRLVTNGNFGCQLIGAIKTLRDFDNPDRKLFNHSRLDFVEDIVYEELSRLRSDCIEIVEVEDGFFIGKEVQLC